MMKNFLLTLSAFALLITMGFTSSAQNLIQNGEFDTEITETPTVDTITQEYTAGDLTLFAFRFPAGGDLVCDANLEIDNTGMLSGDNCGKITIEHSGWVPGYVALKSFISDVEPGVYELSFMYSAQTTTHIGPSFETGHGDGYDEPIMLEQTMVSGEGTYKCKFEVYQALDAATVNIRMGTVDANASDGSWKYGPGYNSGKTIYIDDIKLEKVTVSPMADKNLIMNNEFDIPGEAPSNVDTLTQEFHQGDLTLYAFRFPSGGDLVCDASLTKDYTGRLSGPVSGKIEINHSGWVPGYVALKAYLDNLAAGTYYLSFMYEVNEEYAVGNSTVSDTLNISPSLESGHGDGYDEPIWIDETQLSGKGVYTTSFEVFLDQEKATLSLRLGTTDANASDGSWKYGPGYNSGKTFWIDSLVLSTEPVLYSPSDVVFTVTSDAAAAEGATVEFAGETKTADASGIVTFEAVAPAADLAYTVTVGTQTFEDVVSVMGNSEQVDVTIAATNIANDELNSKLDVYPNPSNGTFNIKAEAGSTYTVFDVAGKMIVKGIINASSEQISIENSGVYIVRVTNNDATLSKRIVVK